MSESELILWFCCQPVAVSESTPDGYWKHGTPAIQNDPSNILQPHAQKPPEVISAYENFQNQQNSTYAQASTSLYAAPYHVSQSHHTSFQTLPPPPEPLDSRKTGKMQIPTNPRIAPNLSTIVSKPNKDNITTTTSVKPAYISVAMQQPNDRVVSQEEADPTLKVSTIYYVSYLNLVRLSSLSVTIALLFIYHIQKSNVTCHKKCLDFRVYWMKKVEI